ncbi:hypothetical protein KY285_021808 [Solanum tuberosum]|nr:hypothetical protein KY284_021919 [Solanum tuberosum]KAH0694711.1 hypothetical protein KY285_021808 [Solanum tuberosum]
MNMWSRHVRWLSTSVATNRKNNMGWWDHVQPAPKDPITSVTQAFLSDPTPLKLNLGVGAYRDDKGKPVTLECVRRAAEKISGCEIFLAGHYMYAQAVSDTNGVIKYFRYTVGTPVIPDTKSRESTKATTKSKFVQDCVKLAYGNDSSVVREDRFAGVPALSGTGACRLFAEFQRRFYPDSQMFLPMPTWSNHHDIWRDSQVCTRTYHYYDPGTKGLRFQALVNDIKMAYVAELFRGQQYTLPCDDDSFQFANAPDRSFFLLHPCAHNPTGVDPNYEQWKEISHIFKIKNHFPFFDMAYQGIASGDVERDATAIRIFLEDGHLLGCAQSFSKNMGLYEHRVGCVSIVSWDDKQATAIKSQLQRIVRAMYSSSPVHGPLLVSTILNDADLKALWEEEVKVMVDRLISMRITLRQTLEELNSSSSWEHITKQVGMFYFSGLSPEEVNHLQRDFHIYMTNDGRISMAGVTRSNVDYLASAIHEVTNNHCLILLEAVRCKFNKYLGTKEVWDALEASLFFPPTLESVHLQLQNLKQDDPIVTQYLDKAKLILGELTSIGRPLCLANQNICIFKGSGSEFKDIITALLARSQPVT